MFFAKDQRKNNWILDWVKLKRSLTLHLSFGN